MTTAILKYTQHEHGESLGAMASKSAKLVSLWLARADQRRQLTRLSPEQLRDIGISRAAALEEAGRPFWSE